MAHIYDYALIRLVPFAHRGEQINVGIVVFRADDLDVRVFAPSLLLNYFNVSARAIDWISKQVKTLDDPSLPLDNRVALLNRQSGFLISERGWFSTDESSQYEARIDEIYHQYIERPKKLVSRKPRSKIGGELKKIFKEYEVFSNRLEDIEKHKIVANMPVGPAGKLHIDFMLKNSIYHATETLDFSASDHTGTAELKSAALANVTFQHAFETLGNYGLKRYLVYSAPSVVERALEPALKIAQRDAEEAFNLESKEDKMRYLDKMLEAAGASTLFNS